MDNPKIFNDKPFYALLIEPGKIHHLDWNHPDYVQKLVSLPNIKCEQFSPTTFFAQIYKLLNVETADSKHLNTVTIGEELDYNYQMVYIDTLNKPSSLEFNEMATMLQVSEEIIRGNAIVIRNYIPALSKDMYMVDMTSSELNKMLKARGFTKVGIWDDEWREEEVYGEMDNFADKFFEGEKYYKLEYGFLKHNIHIWYEKSEYGTKKVCGNLVKDPMTKCIVFSLATPTVRCSLTLDEIKKIIKLSEKLTPKDKNIYEADEYWSQDETDDHGRLIIKNKYRVLENEYHKYFNQNEKSL